MVTICKVGRVGQNLLIPGHTGVETRLSYISGFGAKCAAAKNGSVCKCNDSFVCRGSHVSDGANWEME